jgi:RNA polymerase sigma-70 factor (ECF subfamily)
MNAKGLPCEPQGCAGLCDEQGFAAAHRAYRARLVRRARRIVVDPELAEEAVQEAFLRAWQRCATFDPEQGPMLNWLLVITRNVAIDMVKARSRRPAVAAPIDDQTVEVAIDGLNDVDRILLRDELSGALSGITPAHRAAVVETILLDRPYAEVAAELDVPAATLRTRVHYALRGLRGRLEAIDASMHAAASCACC